MFRYKLSCLNYDALLADMRAEIKDITIVLDVFIVTHVLDE